MLFTAFREGGMLVVLGFQRRILRVREAVSDLQPLSGDVRTEILIY